MTTRTLPPLRQFLNDLVIWRPLDGASALSPLYHPAAWLIVVGLASLAVSGHTSKLASVLAAVGRLGSKPTLITVVYVVFATLVAGGGLASLIAGDAEAVLGNAATAVVAPLGALSGFLTGSNTASNGMMMPVQVELAKATGASLAWAAAVQNIAGSTFTMLSPVRIATACALLGLAGQEKAAYGRGWVLGGIPIAILATCWTLAA